MCWTWFVSVCLYVCVRPTVNTCSSYKFLRVLRHSLIQKRVDIDSLCTSSTYSMTRTRTRMDITHGPTYSIAISIQATAWQKRFICWCLAYCLCCWMPHSQIWPVSIEVTGHIDRQMATYSGKGACQKWRQECFICSNHLIVYMSCRTHGVLSQCATMYRPSVTCL